MTRNCHGIVLRQFAFLRFQVGVGQPKPFVYTSPAPKPDHTSPADNSPTPNEKEEVNL